jgi:hypothetical protein
MIGTPATRSVNRLKTEVVVPTRQAPQVIDQHCDKNRTGSRHFGRQGC